MLDFALDEKQSLYELLEITPDASPQEIRESYLRLKSAYNKGSPALYSLVSQEETKNYIQQIESAYQVLSDPERRRDYDRHHGLIEEPTDFFTQYKPKSSRKIISIRENSDPPSSPRSISDEPFGGGEELLEAPSIENAPSIERVHHESTRPTSDHPTNPATGPTHREDGEWLQKMIKNETEWRGPTIKSIRERTPVSIEELSEHTKVSKNYIRAIESEEYSKLPAAVYLRGFLIQIAKKLKLPHDQVASVYVARYRQATTQAD